MGREGGKGWGEVGSFMLPAALHLRELEEWVCEGWGMAAGKQHNPQHLNPGG